MEAYAKAFPELARELQLRLRGELPAGWDADIPGLSRRRQRAWRRASPAAR